MHDGGAHLARRARTMGSGASIFAGLMELRSIIEDMGPDIASHSFDALRELQFDALREIATIEADARRLFRGKMTRIQEGSTRMTSSKPRKPSAYQKWAKTERKKIAKEHPRYSFGRINKELGIRWKREKRRRGMK